MAGERWCVCDVWGGGVISGEQRSAIEDLLGRFGLDDHIYNVRENTDMTEWDGNSWDHPNVKRYSECITILEGMLKE